MRLGTGYSYSQRVGSLVGLVVTRDISWSRGRGFESQYRKLDGQFFTLICCKNCIACLKRLKINKKWPGMTHFLKKLYNADLQSMCFGNINRSLYYGSEGLKKLLKAKLKIRFIIITTIQFQNSTHRHRADRVRQLQNGSIRKPFCGRSRATICNNLLLLCQAVIDDQSHTPLGPIP